jgi:hypothetical protein
MNELQIHNNSLPSMNEEAINKVRILESVSSQLPQIEIKTSHILHGGMYARTILIPAGTLLTGALIKIATMLIIQGDIVVYIGEDTLNLVGYHIVPAGANRKQAFYARLDTWLTMIFSTDAKTIEIAEDEFTNEANLLISRKDPSSNQIVITGE